MPRCILIVYSESSRGFEQRLCIDIPILCLYTPYFWHSRRCDDISRSKQQCQIGVWEAIIYLHYIGFLFYSNHGIMQ